MIIEINKKVFEKFPKIETERLILRQFLKDDYKTLYEIRTNDSVMEYMDTEPMNTESDAKVLIESITKSFENFEGINWAIEEKDSGQLIGYFGIWRIDEKNCRGEIGYALHPKHFGKGYMQETIKPILEFGFRSLNLHSYEANVNPENKSSIKLLEKNCFKKEAYFRENFQFRGEFKDSVIYSLLESDLTGKNSNET